MESGPADDVFNLTEPIFCIDAEFATMRGVMRSDFVLLGRNLLAEVVPALLGRQRLHRIPQEAAQEVEVREVDEDEPGLFILACYASRASEYERARCSEFLLLVEGDGHGEEVGLLRGELRRECEVTTELARPAGTHSMI